MVQAPRPVTKIGSLCPFLCISNTLTLWETNVSCWQTNLKSSDGLVVISMSYIRLSAMAGSFFELELDLEDDGRVN